MSLLVRQIAAGSTLQDGGRPGWRRFGVPPGGAFDRESMVLCNALLRRSLDAPVVEMAVMGATFDVLESCRVALVGARATVHSSGGPLPSNGAFRLHPGDTLTIGVMTGAARLYLALDANTESPPVLGSQSGQSVKVGNILGETDSYRRWQEKLATGPPPALSPPTEVLQLADPPHSLYRGALRILPGPQADQFDKNLLASEQFVASPQCDRVGLRLDGPMIGQPQEALSEPTCCGAVQVTPSGKLLVLGPDGPTIGGYPKVAVVIDADLDRLAQVLPGQKLWFEWVDQVQAAELGRERAARMSSVVTQLAALR